MMTNEDRQHVQNAAGWRRSMVYSRAIRVGNVIEVSGTTAVDEHGMVLFPGDAAGQLRVCLDIIKRALTELGAGLVDVVRTRIFATDLANWERVAAVHDEYFGEVSPVSSLVGVAALLSPELIVEVEASAIVTASNPRS